MKLGLKILLLLLAVSAVFAQNDVNLDQAIEIAVQNSPQIKVYKEQVFQAKHTIKLAEANFNPVVSGSVDYTRRGPKVSQGGVVVSPDQTSNAGVTVTYPIDISGQMGLVKKGSKNMYDASEIELATNLYELIKNVKTSYLMCLLYKENVETAKSALNLSEEYLVKIQHEVEVGTKARFDITRQENDVAARQNALVSAEGTYNQMINTFNYTLGKESDFVTPTLIELTNIANVQPFENQLIDVALENRTELKKAQKDLELADIYLLNEKKSKNPTMALVGNYNHMLVNKTSSKDDSWSATANVNIPIFDGGVQKENVKIYKSKTDVVRNQIEATKQGIISSVLNAKIGVDTAKNMITTSETSVKLAQEAYDIAKIRYEQNLGTYLDVSDALNSLVSAKNALSAAKYSLAVNLCDLEREIATTEKVDEYTKSIIGEIK